MEIPSYAIGQAVYIRTDVPDYAEETIPFKTLDECVKICATSHANMTLEKVVIFSLVEGEPVSLTLGFVSASKGHRPGEQVASY